MIVFIILFEKLILFLTQDQICELLLFFITYVFQTLRYYIEDEIFFFFYT